MKSAKRRAEMLKLMTSAIIGAFLNCLKMAMLTSKYLAMANTLNLCHLRMSDELYVNMLLLCEIVNQPTNFSYIKLTLDTL